MNIRSVIQCAALIGALGLMASSMVGTSYAADVSEFSEARAGDNYECLPFPETPNCTQALQGEICPQTPWWDCNTGTLQRQCPMACDMETIVRVCGDEIEEPCKMNESKTNCGNDQSQPGHCYCNTTVDNTHQPNNCSGNQYKWTCSMCTSDPVPWFFSCKFRACLP